VSVRIEATEITYAAQQSEALTGAATVSTYAPPPFQKLISGRRKANGPCNARRAAVAAADFSCPPDGVLGTDQNLGVGLGSHSRQFDWLDHRRVIILRLVDPG